MLADWNRAKEDLVKQSKQHHVCSKRWRKPPDGWIKINTDAVCNQRTGQMGWVVLFGTIKGVSFEDVVR